MNHLNQPQTLSLSSSVNLNTNNSQDILPDTEPSQHQEHKSEKKQKINLRNTFISPELAYTNERKKLFDKIGYNKYNSKIPSFQQTEDYKIENSKSMSFVNPNSCIIQNENLFVRKRAKADDSFYEKRILTLSKNRQKRLVSEDSCQQTTRSKNTVVQRLITMRKYRIQFKNEQNLHQHALLYQQSQLNKEGSNETIQDDGEIGKSNNLHQRYNSRTEANVTVNQMYDNDECLNTSYHQEKIKYSGSYIVQPQPDDYLQNIEIDNNNSGNKPICNTDTKNNFMSKRKNRQSNSKYNFLKDQDISQDSRMNAVARFDREYSMENKYYARNMLDQDDDGQLQNMKERSFLASAHTHRQKALQPHSKIPTNKSIVSMNMMQIVPQIKGISQQLLIELFQAKCIDLGITSSQDQMIRFFDIINKAHLKKERKLQLIDMGLGDQSLVVVGKIIKKNKQFSTLDLRKNFISNNGIKEFLKSLKHNNSLVHLNIGCNQISTDGAVALFEALKTHDSIVSLSLANTDCYKNKNKQLTSINSTFNDLGSYPQCFSLLLTIFSPSKTLQNQVACASLEELVLQQNQLVNKNIEELSAVLKSCEKTKLQRLDISQNKLNSKSLLNIIQTMRTNTQIKLSHLIMDKSSLDMGSQQEQVNIYCTLARLLGKELMKAIGRGLMCNEKLDTLLLKGNHLEEESILDLIDALESNKDLRLKILDLSSNRLNDKSGLQLASAVAKTENLEQLNLRDNNLGLECGDAFLFLVQQKRNLWKLQLDMNMIKYVNLMEIEKTCKKNKRNAKQLYIPDIKKQIYHYQGQKDPNVKLDEIGHQINAQSNFIKEGFNRIIIEEEAVHQLIKEGLVELSHIDNKTKTLKEIINKQNELLHELDLQNQSKEKELQRKVDFEKSLIDRYKEFIADQQGVIKKEKNLLAKRKIARGNDEEKSRLQEELKNVLREQELMAMIMDTYEKEIKRRKIAIENQQDFDDSYLDRNECLHLGKDKHSHQNANNNTLFKLAGSKKIKYSDGRKVEVSFSKDSDKPRESKSKKASKKKSTSDVNSGGEIIKIKRKKSSSRKIKMIENLINTKQCLEQQ
ncbi:leucine rich repeat family protein [Stylonychia lemnae]|uniref:Leucine rich repeat family protein n=1 Tax=Stylonychia lemnae TaxID=5949 RepID=A0A078B2I6_STYLE|nr:leucine rich repeat family protein [Stylonychia lemnae]|eukprot:CDW88755.1 leucine rich repeat family protein [Stylonychia lemnae]